MNAFSSRYDEALILASRAHQNQLRKGSADVPYIAHVVHVSVILLRYGFEEEIVIAGLLHDVVEDCGIEVQTIAAAFGETVARLVSAVTKPPGVSWEAARAAMVAQLEAGGPSVAALKAADTLHNIQSVLTDLRREGPLVWNRFRRGAEPTLTYYRAVLGGVRHWLGTHPLADELEQALRELEAGAGETGGEASGE
ncbi:MAG: HD domain-containing protein [Chloroflexaceae bacterium]|nr:HD domain-containing protein [Chloroflexaceae bacterium]